MFGVGFIWNFGKYLIYGGQVVKSWIKKVVRLGEYWDTMKGLDRGGGILRKCRVFRVVAKEW